MANFQDAGEARIGTIIEASAYLQGLIEAANHVINALPADKLAQYALVATGNSQTGVSAHGRHISAIIGDRIANQIPPGRKGMMANSIWSPTALFPKYWSEGGKYYGLPDDDMSVHYVGIPEIELTTTLPLTSLPNGADDLMVIYGIIFVLQARYNDSVIPSIATLPTAPTAPTAPSFTSTDAIADTISLTSIGALPSAPVYTPPSEIADLLGVTDGDEGVDLSINDISHWFSSLGKQIEKEEDPELAQQMIARIQSYGQIIGASLSDSQNVFNANNADFQAEVQRLIEQARITAQEAVEQAGLTTNVNIQNEMKALEAQISQYVNELNLYQSQVAAYQADISKVVQDFQADMASYKETQNNYLTQIERYTELYNKQFKNLVTTNDGAISN